MLSIITVLKNPGETITKCLTSVIEFRKIASFPIEHVFIDACSTDGSIAIIQEYLKSNSGLLISEPDNGIYDAMNKGARMAKGTYLMFMNADDEMISSSCAVEMEKIQQNGSVYDVILYPWKDVLVGGKERLRRPFLSMYRNIAVCHQATIYRSDFFHQIGGFDVRYRLSGDFDFLFKAISRGSRIKIIDSPPICKFRFGGRSMSNPSIALSESKASIWHHIGGWWAWAQTIRWNIHLLRLRIYK